MDPSLLMNKTHLSNNACLSAYQYLNAGQLAAGQPERKLGLGGPG
jgi:hypothetical protein